MDIIFLAVNISSWHSEIITFTKLTDYNQDDTILDRSHSISAMERAVRYLKNV